MIAALCWAVAFVALVTATVLVIRSWRRTEQDVATIVAIDGNAVWLDDGRVMLVTNPESLAIGDKVAIQGA